MSENKSLADQIYERLFAELAKIKEFDSAALEALKKLSPKAGMKKPASLIAAIKIFNPKASQ